MILRSRFDSWDLVLAAARLGHYRHLVFFQDAWCSLSCSRSAISCVSAVTLRRSLMRSLCSLKSLMSSRAIIARKMKFDGDWNPSMLEKKNAISGKAASTTRLELKTSQHSASAVSNADS